MRIQSHPPRDARGPEPLRPALGRARWRAAAVAALWFLVAAAAGEAPAEPSLAASNAPGLGAPLPSLRVPAAAAPSPEAPENSGGPTALILAGLFGLAYAGSRPYGRRTAPARE